MIPYFYLKVGDIEVFQPQNKGSRQISSGHVYSRSHPDISDRELYLNGDNKSLQYRICVNIRNRYSDILYKMVSELKNLEE